MHTRLDPDTDKKYWDFSFQEMAEFDLPAVFEYVLKQAKTSTLTYMGHS